MNALATIGGLWGLSSAAAAVLIGRACRLGDRMARALDPGEHYLPAPVGQLRASELLWLKPCTDLEGTITLAVQQMPRGHLGVWVTQDDVATGLRLTRAEVMELRDVITRWLVGTARVVAQ